jgi:hypothetical protein
MNTKKLVENRQFGSVVVCEYVAYWIESSCRLDQSLSPGDTLRIDSPHGHKFDTHVVDTYIDHARAVWVAIVAHDDFISVPIGGVVPELTDYKLDCIVRDV